MNAELIARLEKATAGSRGLDSAIAAHIGISGWDAEDWKRITDDPTFGPDPAIPEAPAYTTSLDAALTLVPEGMHWTLGYGVAELHDLRNRHTYEGEHFEAQPALALCIAALKARESKTND